MNKYIKLFITAGIVILSDQITKSIVLNNIPLFSSLTVIDGFFNLTHLQNPGGAFSLFANQSFLLRKFFFIALPLILLVFLFYFYRSISDTQKYLAFGISLIIGGALGNLIDRFRFGKVTDFLDFYIKDIHWPSFNLADSSIFVGITIFMLHILFVKTEK